MYIPPRILTILCALVLGFSAYVAAVAGTKYTGDAPLIDMQCPGDNATPATCTYKLAGYNFPAPLSQVCPTTWRPTPAPQSFHMVEVHVAHNNSKQKILNAPINIADVDRGSLEYAPTVAYYKHGRTTGSGPAIVLYLERCTHEGKQDDEIVTEQVTIPITSLSPLGNPNIVITRTPG